MKRSLILLALAWALAACENDKETTNPIPDSLAGTNWTATTQEGDLVSLAFDAETYTLEQYSSYDGKTTREEEPSEQQPTLTYRYARPRVELLEDAETVLSGEIATDGKSQLTMTLQNADKNVTLRFLKAEK
ncbi:MAG: hypothetical protein K2I32_04060 [Alistipes sp.]|nr:hypothetical protein [Alistipes sp.]